MDKKFNLVSDLKVAATTIALSAGIMITLFSCTDEIVTSNVFVESDMEQELILEAAPDICADIEIALASNDDTSINEKKIAYTEGSDQDVLGNFVSSILKGTKSMDSDFSKFVDDNFWDLI
jgi:hypothetical protein